VVGRSSRRQPSLPGPQILASRSYTNAEIAPSLGRNRAIGVNGVAAVQLIEPGTIRRAPHQLDLRASKVFRFGRSRLQANVDLTMRRTRRDPVDQHDLRIELDAAHERAAAASLAAPGRRWI
jgi:hypothetical protein